MRLEALDGLQAAGLTILALLLGPDDRLPVRSKHQASAGICDLDAVPARFVDVEEECLLDRVLVRPRFDEIPFSRKMSAARTTSSRLSRA
jgi:hypothetical protein